MPVCVSLHAGSAGTALCHIEVGCQTHLDWPTNARAPVAGLCRSAEASPHVALGLLELLYLLQK